MEKINAWGNKKNSILLTVLVILSGVFLRLWHLKELFHFTYDESVFAYVGRRMFIKGHIPLIGGVTPFHVHLGPYFYWLSGIILRLGNFDPVIWGIFAVLCAVFTMVLLAIVARMVFSPSVSLFSATFYAFSFFIILSDRRYWGLMFNPLLSILTIFSLLMIVKGKEIYTIILSITLAFGFHSDPSSWVLILVSIITLLWFRRPSKRWAMIGFLLFFISFLPLILFDIRHAGINIGGLKYYGEEAHARTYPTIQKLSSTVLFLPRVLGRSLFITGNTDLAKQYAYCPQFSKPRLDHVPWWVMSAAIGVVLLGFVRIRRQYKPDTFARNLEVIMVTYFACLYLGMIIYGLFFGGVLFDHYFSTAFPFFAILFGLVGSFIWKRKKGLAVIIILLFIVINVYDLLTANHSYGYLYKKQAVRWVLEEVGNKDFSLESLGSCFKYSGYRYLFTKAGKEPKKSYVDQNFFWLFDQLPAYKHPKTTVVFVNPANQESYEFYNRYQYFLRATIKKKTFGGFEVLIVNNSSGVFNGDY